MLLRVPDRHREHPLRDVLAAHRHVRQGQGDEGEALQRRRDGARRQEEGQLGHAVDGIRVSWRHSPNSNKLY